MGLLKLEAAPLAVFERRAVLPLTFLKARPLRTDRAQSRPNDVGRFPVGGIPADAREAERGSQAVPYCALVLKWAALPFPEDLDNPALDMLPLLSGEDGLV